MRRRSIAIDGFLAAVALAPRAATAACEISNLLPTRALPTRPAIQPFSFEATGHCRAVSFSAQHGALTKEPQPAGPAVGGRRLYEVELSPSEWHALTGPDETTFTWTITGRTTGQLSARVTATNELDTDRDGWTRTDGDVGVCDADTARNPGTTEVAGNGIDDDCDHAVDNWILSLDDANTIVRGPEHDSGFGWGLTTADFNADGFPDLTATAGDDYRDIYLLYGPTTGITRADDDGMVIASTPTASVGRQLAAGDADGDGAADLLTSNESGILSLLFLGPFQGDRTAADADVVLQGDLNATSFEDLEIVPDASGDGVPDIVIASPQYDSVFVVSGSTSGTVVVRDTATYTFEGVGSLALTDLGDANGDGVDDLVMAAHQPRPGGAAYVVEGGAPPGTYDVADVAAATILDPRRDAAFGTSMASGDYDGDGSSDLFVGAIGDHNGRGDKTGLAFGFVGPLSGALSATDAYVTWVPLTKTEAYLGQAVAVGDVDGDERADVLIEAPMVDESGAVYLQLGPDSGSINVDTLPSFRPRRSRETYMSFACIPDWNGDGAMEIAIGVPSADDDKGAVFIMSSTSLF